jgi:c-di-GMP-binding flagellar brake protein YcgR
MTQLQTAAAAEPRARPTERRRHQRVRVALLGRYMLPNRHEYPCQTIDISPGGALLLAPVKGQIGERIVAYFEHIGRIEGEITRHVEQGFAISFSATIRKRDKIGDQLTWLANREVLGLPEDRRHGRIVPINPVTVLRLQDGREFRATLIDISPTGAGVSIKNGPDVGASVTVGRTPAKVVRRSQDSIAVEFLKPLPPERFDEGIVL